MIRRGSVILSRAGTKFPRTGFTNCGRMAQVSLPEFPVWGLVPKKETGASALLERFPDFDGRGVVIAVFDTGVDPGAPGLQVTSDGKPKVIDRIDCSGSGDVDTSTVVEKGPDGVIVGLSGRKLKIPDSWKCPSGKFHIGLKDISTLYPKSVAERVMKERKTKVWDSAHKLAVANAVKEFKDFEKSKSSEEVDLEVKFQSDELEARVEVLSAAERTYPPFLIPSADCVVFHDGERWRACVDAEGQGDLEKCKVMGIYRETLEFSSFSDRDVLNYSFNIYDEGNLLEIVAVPGSHGTHVASIASANFADEPEKNGVAPGTQIVSIGIADSRLATMETGTCLIRAMNYVIASRLPGFPGPPIDLINMSYGECTSFTDSGRIAKLMSEVVVKYGVIWVNSAGNEGPSLSTVGVPPDLADDSLIGIGAYVFPEMVIAEYSLREKVPEMPFTWASRGPTNNGARGVSLVAPGAAVTSVPNFTLKNNALMNGSSMASPNACGCFALVLSGLKAKKLPYTPFSVRRSMEVTAKAVDRDCCFAEGHGLIQGIPICIKKTSELIAKFPCKRIMYFEFLELQVDKALDHLLTWSKEPVVNMNFVVNVGTNRMSGIYIRGNYGESATVHERSVEVVPMLLNDEEADTKTKIDFDKRLVLSSSASWLKHSSHLSVSFGAKTFVIRVDPTGLKPGVHFAAVKAYDVSNPGLDWLFEVPVTVVKPEPVTEQDGWMKSYEKVHFEPGVIKRHFFLIPDGATFCVFRMKAPVGEKSARFILHCVHFKNDESYRGMHLNRVISISQDSSEAKFIFQVREKLTLEVTVAKWWASLGSVSADYSIEFGSVKPSISDSTLTIHGSDGVTRVDVRTELSQQEILPSISLKQHVVVLRPTEWKLEPLGVRDTIPGGGRIYAVNLSYNLHVPKSGIEVVPVCSLLGDYLYENEVESQLWMLFDSNKRLVASGDAFPANYKTKLDKGDYVIKLQLMTQNRGFVLKVRHDKKELLEKVAADLIMTVSMKLSSAINLDVYPTWNDAITSGKKFRATTCSKNTSVSAYISPFLPEKPVKLIPVGHMLTGTICYVRDEWMKKACSYPIRFVIAEHPKKNSNAAGKEEAGKGKKKDDEKDEKKTDAFKEAVRELKISWIGKLDDEEARRKLYLEVSSSEGDNGDGDKLDAHVAYLQSLSSKVDLCKEEVEVDPKKLDQIVEGRLDEAGKREAADAVMQALKFADATDAKVIRLIVRHALALGHRARAVKYLWKIRSGDVTGVEGITAQEAELWAAKLCDELGWPHVSRLARVSIPTRFPPTYELF
ncbi:unnamed protein product [Notodromas monacha]|uniref:Tripeptidyl-peptidase 2 n=1 Tax=Notodromas monacha TaxID=399045 RepID=A0A7R9BPR7_9CRUS|nr:unnamed protein product [Notodromas monacha]CAG0918332.1 unnamed protein product [Notodromas monacha]